MIRATTLTLMGVILGGAASAQTEDAFEAFQVRCLTPMLEVRDSDTSGLTLLESMAGGETWISAEETWHLHRAAADEVIQYCAIIGGDPAAQSAVWVEAALASGNYEMVDREPLTLQSIFLREPRIEVEIDRLVPSVTVIETNLES